MVFEPFWVHVQRRAYVQNVWIRAFLQIRQSILRTEIIIGDKYTLEAGIPFLTTDIIKDRKMTIR